LDSDAVLGLRVAEGTCLQKKLKKMFLLGLFPGVPLH